MSVPGSNVTPRDPRCEGNRARRSRDGPPGLNGHKDLKENILRDNERQMSAHEQAHG